MLIWLNLSNSFAHCLVCICAINIYQYILRIDIAPVVDFDNDIDIATQTHINVFWGHHLKLQFHIFAWGQGVEWRFFWIFFLG